MAHPTNLNGPHHFSLFYQETYLSTTTLLPLNLYPNLIKPLNNMLFYTLTFSRKGQSS